MAVVTEKGETIKRHVRWANVEMVGLYPLSSVSFGKQARVALYLCMTIRFIKIAFITEPHS